MTVTKKKATPENKELSALVKVFSEKYCLDKDSVVPMIHQIAFMSAEPETVTTGDVLVLMTAANHYNLDPFMREIYACINDYGRYEPVVTVAGWSKVINRQANFGCVQFRYAPNTLKVETSQECPEWIECEIYTKGYERPTVVREYLIDNYRNTTWWDNSTARQLRHKALIQGGRLAFGLTGIADADEVSLPKPARVKKSGPAAVAKLDAVKDSAEKSAVPLGGLEKAKSDLTKKKTGGGEKPPVAAAHTEAAAVA